MRPILAELQTLLFRFDDAAFEALANRGLLRRAQKDLEKTVPAMLPDEPELVVVQVGVHRVRFDSRGPAHARCDCPAAGVCQHILSGALWIRSMAPAAADVPLETLHTELLAISHTQMETWAGKANFRWAVQHLRDIDTPEAVNISGERNIVVAFDRPRFSCRFVGKDLAAAVVESVSGDIRKYVAASVLAYQLAHGKSLPEAERRVAAASLDLGREHRAPEGAAASRAELRGRVLESARRLVIECVVSGLSHLSAAIGERFTTLAVAAQGADLHRLALLLRRLADQTEMLVRRDGGASEEELLDDLALANALVAALHAAGVARGAEGPRHLVGEARTAYENMGNLELIGLGAYPWRTQSGYLGLTVVLYDADREEWFTWSEARPEIQGNFDPLARYKAGGPWPGCGAPSQLVGKQVRLIAVQANRGGRLSAAEGTTAIVREAFRAETLLARAVTDWETLASRQLARAGTLSEPDPRANWCVLKPANFLPARFDPIAQVLEWPLEDARGGILIARIPHSEYNAHAISRIEAMSEAGTQPPLALIGRLDSDAATAEQPTVWPISLLNSDSLRPVDAIFFDAPAAQQSGFAKFMQRLGRFTALGSGAGSATAMPLPPRSSAVNLLEQVAAQGLRMAERGLMNPAASSFDALETELQRCDRFGLSLPIAIWGAAPVGEEAASRSAALLRVHHAVRQLRRQF